MAHVPHHACICMCGRRILPCPPEVYGARGFAGVECSKACRARFESSGRIVEPAERHGRPRKEVA